MVNMKKPGDKIDFSSASSLWSKFDNKMKTSRVFAILYWFWMIPLNVLLIFILAQFSLNIVTVIVGVWLTLVIIVAWGYGLARMVDNFDI
jgi:hypothetical protein